MAIESKVPSLAEGVDGADVAQIRVCEGHTIEEEPLKPSTSCFAPRTLRLDR